MSELDLQRLRALLTARLAGTVPVLDPERLRLPGFPGDLPARLRPKLRSKPPRPAAVLVPVIDRPSGLSVLLTRRTEHLADHAGQISFPGGSIEAADASPVAAALREAEEEIGLGRDFVRVIGYLDTYLTITGFAVTPVVGFVREGFVLKLDAFEVAEAFEVPLPFLLDPRNRSLRMVDVQGVEVGYYEMHYEGRRIWGATAGMVVGLCEKLSNKS